MISRFPAPFSSSRSQVRNPLLDLHQELDRMVQNAFGGFAAAPWSVGEPLGAPSLDVHETDHEFCVTADVPGVQADDLDVRLDGAVLTITGEKKRESDEAQRNYHMVERSYGRFSRSLQLPFAPEPGQVKAEFNAGVLTLHIPKQAHLERSNRIPVITGNATPAPQETKPTAH